MVRLLLADDHDVVRRGLREIVEEQPGWAVCAEATNGREAVELAARLRPHVAVLDVGMPELNGIEATRQIVRLGHGTEVLVFTMHHSEELVREALAAGAKGFMLKSDAARLIVSAVETLSRHKPFLNPDASEAVLRDFLSARAQSEGRGPPALSGREREVLQLVAEGHPNKVIAGRLSLSVKTVEAHRIAAMRKIGARSVADLVRYAVRNRIITP